MKGFLDVKDLEKYKKADLEELAKKLGVDAEGTVKELAERCAAVEVEIPDDDKQGVDAVILQTYNDLELKRIVEAGETITVTPERAALLIEKNIAKLG